MSAAGDYFSPPRRSVRAFEFAVRPAILQFRERPARVRIGAVDDVHIREANPIRRRNYFIGRNTSSPYESSRKY